MTIDDIKQHEHPENCIDYMLYVHVAILYQYWIPASVEIWHQTESVSDLFLLSPHWHIFTIHWRPMGMICTCSAVQTLCQTSPSGQTLSETRNSKRHSVIIALGTKNDPNNTKTMQQYVSTIVVSIKSCQFELLGIGVVASFKDAHPSNKCNVETSSVKGSVGKCKYRKGQLSEVKIWATSGAQLGIVVLQVCILPSLNWKES